MTCIWNGSLHGQRVDRSNKYSQKQFLHPNHWIQIPKSRKCDKHIWFVVRPRIGPVAASLNRLIDLLWRRIAASYSTTKTCAHLENQLQNKSTFSPLKKAHAEGMHLQIKWHTSLPSVQQFGSIKHYLDLFTLILLDANRNPAKYEHSIFQWFNLPHIQHQDYIADATHYWPFTREYSVWNAAVTALQFWMADHEPHICSNAIEIVYTAFFCSDLTHQLRNQPEEIIFSCFVTTLNDAFE